MAKLIFAILLLWIAASANADFTCTSEGMFADPDHCENFIQCTIGQVNEDGTYDYNKYVNTCPEGTNGLSLYEACDRACEDPAVYDIDCGPRPHPDGTVDDPNADIYVDCPANAPPPPDGATTTPGVTTEGTTEAATSPTTDGDTTPKTTPTPSEEPTTHPSTSNSRYPEKVVGFYVVLSDDYWEGYETEAEWDPMLYEYQQECTNLLFFSFINPDTMVVPKSFAKLASSRGTGLEGAVPADTLILFAIGGQAYSQNIDPWDWLTSREKAEAMAEEVSEWRLLYNMDGIDLDIESGAGDHFEAGVNMVYFIDKLRELDPGIIIAQPTYGFPQIKAETIVINNSWNPDGSSNNRADSVGLMVYEGTTSLDYVENYAHGTEQWEGFPIHVNVPYNSIMVGAKGIISDEDADTIATEVVGKIFWASWSGLFQSLMVLSMMPITTPAKTLPVKKPIVGP